MKKETILFLLLLLIYSYKGVTQTGFNCDGQAYVIASNSSSTLYRTIVNNITGVVTFNEIATTNNHTINAIGYRISDNLIYGIDYTNNNLYRVDATGTIELLSSLGLNEAFSYPSGDVTKDGDYLVLFGNGLSSNANSLVLINLISGNYELTEHTLSSISGTSVFCTDIAFHPITGELFGFDVISSRLIKINISSQVIDNVFFPTQIIVSNLPALFFNPFGELFGLGVQNAGASTNIYKVDVLSGEASFFASASALDGDKDGCACPYTVSLTQSILPDTLFPCTETLLTFSIANLSDTIQTEVEFSEILQESIEVLEIIYNPFGGNVQATIGSNEIHINDMTIPVGIDSVIVRVNIGELEEGEYKNQAFLSNIKLPGNNNAIVPSDDPSTAINNDSTSFHITPLFLDLDNNEKFFCEDSTLILNTSIEGGVSYLWNDGSTNNTLEVNYGGLYSVTVSTGCEFFTDSILVEQASLFLDFGENITIELGDEITLSPFIYSTGGIVSYKWLENNNIINENCTSCDEYKTTPLNNTLYTLCIEDEFGCPEKGMIDIYVEKNYNIYVPNVFSPNNDGVNDVFFIQSKRNLPIKYFRVFNRWGDMLFEQKDFYSNSQEGGWTGFFKGKAVEQGVYLWTTELEFVDGTVKMYSGDVIILK